MQCRILPQSKEYESEQKNPQYTFTHTSLMNQNKFSSNTYAHASFGSAFDWGGVGLIEGVIIFDNTDGYAKQF